MGRNPLSHSPRANARGLPSNTRHALTHPHLYTLMPTQKYTHTHTHILLCTTCTHICSRSCSCTCLHTRTQIHTHPRFHTYRCTDTETVPTYKCTLFSHMHVHGHINTLTRAHSHNTSFSPLRAQIHTNTLTCTHTTHMLVHTCVFTHTHTQLATPAFDTGEGRQKCRQKSGSKAHTHPLYQNSPAQAAPVSGSPVSLLSFSCCPSRPLAAPQDPISVPGPPSPWPEHSPPCPPHFSLFVHLSICYLEATGLGYPPANRNFSETTSHVFLPGTSKEHH